MGLSDLLEKIKRHSEYHRAGMILCHNGVVRGTSRSGRSVTGLRVAVDADALQRVVDEHKRRRGIIDIQVEIHAGIDLAVGEDIMYLAVAGDVRENVIPVLQDVLNAIKKDVTCKTEYGDGLPEGPP